jgi:uncharacterized protein (TIGR03083 family)
MSQTTTAATTPRRITAGDDATQLALTAYDQLLDLLDTLSSDDWEQPTDCTDWTVRLMVAHLVGAARGHASTREMARQAVHGMRHKAEFDGNDLDAMNALQVADHEHLSPVELIRELRVLAPTAVSARMRRARLMGWVRLPIAPSGSWSPGVPRSVSLADLSRVVLTRDVWVHRLDIARAVRRPLAPTTDVDGRMTADVVGEWFARHGQPVALTLTGPAGGRYVHGVGGPDLTVDAIDFVRVLAGRPADGAVPDSPLLATTVLF